jgi:hypothetical protein
VEECKDTVFSMMTFVYLETELPEALPFFSDTVYLNSNLPLILIQSALEKQTVSKEDKVTSLPEYTIMA